MMANMANNQIVAQMPQQIPQQMPNNIQNNPNPMANPPNHLMQRRKYRNNHQAATEKLSLEEDAKQVELAYLPSKTPVSVLQELLSRRGITPNYELVQIEGAIHEPIFRYSVFMNSEFFATGTGRSKKEAKHGAAKNLLDLIAGRQSVEQANSTNGNALSEAPQTQTVVSPHDDKVMGNPIGWLQEMCMSRRWPPPLYSMENEDGLPHDRVFTTACQVLKYRELGTGKSKKLAKRVAAHKMWQTLQDLPQEATGAPQNPDDEEETINLNSPNFKPVHFLHEIGKEQGFEVTYVDIEEKSVSGKYQCLVQLSTLPVAVSFGSGSNPKAAQASAALNALEYLRLMTRK